MLTYSNLKPHPLTVLNNNYLKILKTLNKNDE